MIFMSDIEKYYEKTKNALPHENVKEFIKIENKQGKAIDIGCGAGRDTVFLIKNNWSVIAIDREDTKDTISSELNDAELRRFRFSRQDFENIKLEENDLVVANFSIPFCNKKYFSELWNKIVESISEDGYFVGNFFGLNDSWVNIKENMVFLSKEQVLKLFEESFKIIKFKENEKGAKTALGKIKQWHIYEIIAKKRKKKDKLK